MSIDGVVLTVDERRAPFEDQARPSEKFVFQGTFHNLNEVPGVLGDLNDLEVFNQSR